MYFMEAAIGQFAQVTYINSILNPNNQGPELDPTMAVQYHCHVIRTY